jgi:Ca2+-binding RTX toxin-like protein
VTIHHETAPDAQTTSTARVASVAIGQGPCDPDTLLIGGTQAGDTISVSPVGATGAVAVQINKEPVVVVQAGSFSSIAVYGQDGADNVQISGSVNRTAFLFGQGGNDRLKGGGGNNFVAGGAGNDTLSSDNSSGFSILIGGAGSDRLVGNGGSDLLIGGVVDFEDPLNCDNDPLICNLLSAWAAPAQDYATRAAAVGTLLSGHVGNDFAADVLTGSSGQDLFYLSPGDTVTDKKSGEIGVTV